ncbi:MAG: hypothetical protein KA144_00690 [Xanthomonadaceae bacterium]|nr:hypothetical protein [Xanthomonadaceae bacterium]
MSPRLPGRAMRLLSPAVFPCALFAAFCAALAASPVAAQSKTREIGSLRVATFNTYLLSNQFRCIDHRLAWDPITTTDCFAKGDLLGLTLDPEEIDAAADAIANSILSIENEVDIVVLNEVWDERARDRLVLRLSAVFPSHVSKIDLGASLPLSVVLPELGVPDASLPHISGEDSGLMLFAKRDVEFLPFAREAPVILPSAIEGNVPHVRAETLNVRAISVDALAAKAVAAVHVRQRIGTQNIRAYIVFTHMQADDEFAAVRERQLQQIRNFIEAEVIDPNLGVKDELKRVLVFGDLNIDGMRGVIPTSLSKPPVKEEWQNRFASPDASEQPFDDLWATTTSEKDFGPTYLRGSIDGSSRYDYALGVRPQGQVPEGLGFCAQHMKIRLEDSYSDHSALVSDFNQPFPFCSPRTALQPAFDAMVPGSHDGIADAIRIDRPGAMQWFHFPLESAATIDVVIPATTPVRSTMFAADNLSRPIAPVENSARVSTYSVPDDFFIRIEGKQRSFAGDYTVSFLRRKCLSADRPCVLTPTLPQEAVFPANNLLGNEDSAWFRIAVTDLPDGAKSQGISIMFRGLNANLKPTLMLESDPNAVVDSDTFSINGRGTVITFSPTAAANYLVKVTRGADKSAEQRIRVGWDTNLTVVKVRSLVCADETNGIAGSEAGEDEIAHFVEYDGISRRNPTGGWRDFDCNTSNHERADFAQTMKALKAASTWLQEQDDGHDDNDSPRQSIPTLGSGQLEARSETVRWEFEGGTYFLRFDRLKGSSGRE